MDRFLEALAVAGAALCDQNEALEEFQHALHHEQRRFQALLSFVSKAIITTDGGGIIRGASPSAAKLLGLTPRYLIGRPFVCRAPKGEHLIFEKVMAQALLSGTSPQSLRLRVALGLAPGSATASAITDETGVATDLLWRLQPEVGSTL